MFARLFLRAVSSPGHAILRFEVTALRLLIVGLFGAGTVLAADSPAARHLFLDPAFVEREHVALRVNPAEQREVVIRPDKPWEQLMISFFLTVREEEGKLRMWYICRDRANQPNVAYAESRDGVTWVKPELGVVDYEGSKANNLVGLDSLEGVVFRDPNAPETERYAYVTHLWTEGMVRFHSPDGLRWQRDAAPLLRFGADTQNVTYWDDRLGRYVLYLRGWFIGADKLRYRRIVRVETPSLTTQLPQQPSEESLRLWGKEKCAVIGDDFPAVFSADERDPKNSDVYNISAQPYPLDPQWIVGFPSLFQRDRNAGDGKLEVQFAGSRDGTTWHRYDRAPYAPVGLSDSDSANMTFMGTGLVVRGDEIWQYGTGFRSRHGDREARQRRTDGVIYRYVQRVDGFVSLDFGEERGDARTTPVRVDGPRLLLNVDTGVFGSLRVALSDAEGTPLQGFAAADCEPVRTNATGAAVTWGNGADLSALHGREVRVTFAGTRAKLYSFRFAQ